MKTLTLAAFIGLAIIACHPDTGLRGAPDSQLRDSAGIQVVENARPPGRTPAGLANRHRARRLHRGAGG